MWKFHPCFCVLHSLLLLMRLKFNFFFVYSNKQLLLKCDPLRALRYTCSSNTRVYILSSGSHVKNLLAVVSRRRKNFEQLFFFRFKANTECRQQMTTIKLLHKYFTTKHFDLTVTNNQIRCCITANRWERFPLKVVDSYN